MAANVILPAQLVQLLDCLMSVREEPGVAQERVDAFVFVVMSVIPWASANLRETVNRIRAFVHRIAEFHGDSIINA